MRFWAIMSGVAAIWGLGRKIGDGCLFMSGLLCLLLTLFGWLIPANWTTKSKPQKES